MSYPRFLTLFLEWLRFLVLTTWLVKTENYFRWWKKKSAFGLLFLNFDLFSLKGRGIISCLQSNLRLHSWEKAEGGRWLTFPVFGSTFSFNQQQEKEVLKLILPKGSLVVKSKTSSVIWARRVNVSSERKEYIKGNVRGYPYRGPALHT